MMNLIGAILGPILSIIDKAVPDKDLREKLKAEVSMAIIAKEVDLQKTLRDIAMAEVTGNRFQSSWRPLLAYLLIFLLAWAYVLVPLMNAFGFPIEGPPADGIATLAGVFGAVYGLGRTFEKSGSKIEIGTKS